MPGTAAAVVATHMTLGSAVAAVCRAYPRSRCSCPSPASRSLAAARRWRFLQLTTPPNARKSAHMLCMSSLSQYAVSGRLAGVRRRHSSEANLSITTPCVYPLYENQLSVSETDTSVCHCVTLQT